MKRKSRAWICVAICAVLCGVASDATADSGPEPIWFHASVGNWPSNTPGDQDVRLWFEIYDVEPGKIVTMPGKEIELPGFHTSYNLKRKRDEKTRYLFEDRVFVKSEAIGGGPYGCKVWPGNACGDFPSEECDCPENWSCDDCDDDGVAECSGFCAASYFYEMVDECVSPGVNSYYFEANSDSEPLVLEVSSITMTDTGDPCLGSDGCATVAVGLVNLREALLFVALLGLGLGAFFMSRRKHLLRRRGPRN